jgi:hypothetical protein
MKLRTMMIAAALAAALHTPLVQAQQLSQASHGISNASAAISAGSGLVVQGSLQMVAGAGQLSVAAIQVVGESTVLVLRGVGTAVEVSVQIASQIARDLSLAVGTVVQVVAEGVGFALVSAGRMIAFIPNELGRSFLYQARLR